MPKLLNSTFPSTLQQTYEWLMSLRLISCPIDEVPQSCIDGTLICRIIEKLEGRSCTLGFHRSPKTFSACRANLKQGLEYLRKFPKFQSKHLWSYDEVLHGDPETIWELLSEICEFYSSSHSYQSRPSNIIRPCSVQLRSKQNFYSSSGEKQEIYSQTELNQVKAWISELGLAYLLRPGLADIKDPVKNGVLLCKILNQVKDKFEFFTHPKGIEEVLENIRSVLFEVKAEIKGFIVNELMDESRVWVLIGKIMKTFKGKEKSGNLPYTPAELKNLQHSLFKWVFGLKPFEQFYPENFVMLCKALKTGVVLIKIVEKVIRCKVEFVKYPNCEEDFLRNIELAFDILKEQENMSKGYLWEPIQILKCNSSYIIALLEDLHRFSAGLPPRKMGDDYHSDGPFYGKQLNFSISYAEEKSVWNANSIYMSPERSQQVKSMMNSRTSSPIAFKTASNFRNSCDFSIGDISPKLKQEKTKNLSNFTWIEKIGIKLPADLDLTSEKINQFRSGELLCEILQKLEGKTFPGVRKTQKGTAAAAKNVSVAFEVLRKKSAFGVGNCFLESKVIEGEGEHLRRLLREIYRLYQNTVLALMKFNRSFYE